MYRGELLHYFTAVALFFQHVLHAAHLAFDPPQALDKFFFSFRVLNFHLALPQKESRLTAGKYLIPLS